MYRVTLSLATKLLTKRISFDILFLTFKDVNIIGLKFLF